MTCTKPKRCAHNSRRLSGNLCAGCGAKNPTIRVSREGDLNPAARLSYFGVALNAQRKLAQVLVTREGGKSSQRFTGVTYRTKREAFADISRLNCN